jgi:hypothetical protein
VVGEVFELLVGLNDVEEVPMTVLEIFRWFNW